MTDDTLGTQRAPRLPGLPRAHTVQQPTRPLLRHQSNNPPRSDSGPAFKKLRLDHEPERAVSSSKLYLYPRLGDSGAAGLQSPRPIVPTSSVSGPSQQDFSNTSSTALPLFPLRSTAGRRQSHTHGHNTVVKRSLRGPGNVQIKPFVSEFPSLAPRYQSGSDSASLEDRNPTETSLLFTSEDVADFLPWKGDHAEDVLSESTTKQGFYDKVQVSQTESSTARPSVWSSLKHKSGLQVLSSLVVSVLDQRQAHGTNTATCTFKPPPRVTLTDSKREAWLRDLANPTISLRRLSRTIPHGIRGRALLDQCLCKHIPTARALWLAKCVGANEIRAFKRKGASGAFAVGGETKWIRDWTANVEQFLDAIIGGCSSSEWSDNLTYALKLATHLHAEGLLDREHYFDWLLSALNCSDLDTLSLYMLIVRTHLDEIGQTRRFGQRLANVLLTQLHKIKSQPSPDTYNAVRITSSELVRSFIDSSPASFLLPKEWQLYEPMLRGIVGPPSTAAYERFEEIRKRNARLRALSESTRGAELMAHRTIIKVLDSTLSSPLNSRMIALDLQSVSNDSNLLVQACLEWSASVHRYGHARVYIAARLLREWHGIGINVETPILDFVKARSDACDLDLSSFYKVVVELVQSRHFSVGRYLQWVIANGFLGRLNASSMPSCAVGLILAMPLDALPKHLQNLRQNLLRSIGVPTEDEQLRIAQAKAVIDWRLRSEIEDDGSHMVSDNPLSHLSQESMTVKSSIGCWISQKAMIHPGPQQAVAERRCQDPDPGTGCLSHIFGSVAGTRTLIRVLEDLDDYPAIATVLARCSTCRHPQMLTLATVTINHYKDIFFALGAASKLFTEIFQRQARLETQNGRRFLLEALVDLAEGLPDCSVPMRALQTELRKYDVKLSVAARSPISDHMIESLQSDDDLRSGSACTDEVEQLLASGNSMDRRLIRSVFDLIWRRFETTWTDSIQSSVGAISLISRLRTFDVNIVDEMLMLRLEKTLCSESRPKLMRIVVPLVCGQSISLEQLLGLALRLVQGLGATRAHERLLVEITEMITASRPRVASSIDHSYYRFYNQQQLLVRKSSPIIVSLRQQVLQSAHITQGTYAGDEGKCLSVLRMLPDSTAADFQGNSEIFGSTLEVEAVARTFGSVLFPAQDERGRHMSQESKLPFLLARVGVLSLPLSCLYLQAVMNGRDTVGGDATQLVISTILELGLSASSLKTQLWASMIASLLPKHRILFRDKAESEFFALLAGRMEPQVQDFQTLTQCLLSCMRGADEKTNTAVSAARILVLIQENLARLMGALHTSRGRHPAAEKSASTGTTAEESLIYLKLDALLHLLYTRQSIFSAPNVSESEITELLVSLSLLVFHPFPDQHTHIPDEICDYLIIIVDHLSPAIQLRCIRTLHNQRHFEDSRLSYIYGFAETTEDKWLQMLTGLTSTRKTTRQLFSVRRWETLPDATPLMTENDTSVSLTLFGATKAVL